MYTSKSGTMNTAMSMRYPVAARIEPDDGVSRMSCALESSFEVRLIGPCGALECLRADAEDIGNDEIGRASAVRPAVISATLSEVVSTICTSARVSDTESGCAYDNWIHVECWKPIEPPKTSSEHVAVDPPTNAAVGQLAAECEPRCRCRCTNGYRILRPQPTYGPLTEFEFNALLDCKPGFLCRSAIPPTDRCSAYVCAYSNGLEIHDSLRQLRFRPPNVQLWHTRSSYVDFYTTVCFSDELCSVSDWVHADCLKLADIYRNYRCDSDSLYGWACPCDGGRRIVLAETSPAGCWPAIATPTFFDEAFDKFVYHLRCQTREKATANIASYVEIWRFIDDDERSKTESDASRRLGGGQPADRPDSPPGTTDAIGVDAGRLDDSSTGGLSAHRRPVAVDSHSTTVDLDALSAMRAMLPQSVSGAPRRTVGWVYSEVDFEDLMRAARRVKQTFRPLLTVVGLPSYRESMSPATDKQRRAMDDEEAEWSEALNRRIEKLECQEAALSEFRAAQFVSDTASDDGDSGPGMPASPVDAARDEDGDSLERQRRLSVSAQSSSSASSTGDHIDDVDDTEE